MDVERKNLKAIALGMGSRAFGIADLDLLRAKTPDLLERVGPGYTRALVVGVRLQATAFESIVDKPTPLYMHNYRQANYQLDSIGFMLADSIQERGYRALAVAASQVAQKSPMVGHISHKLLGWAAGIGFIGRSSLLIHPEYGARMRYVSVLTDMPLPTDLPASGDCGECRACLTACPAHAIGVHFEDFNLQACFEKLTEFSRIPFIGQHICGICVKACTGKACWPQCGMGGDHG